MIAAALALAAAPVQAPTLPHAPRTGPVPGLLWADLDADGDLDALALGAGGSVRLLAQHGEGIFVDETAARGLEGFLGVEQALAGDVDGDGSVELVLGGPSGLWILESVGGAFVDATESAGLDRTVVPTALAWVDADQDGVLDLHVATRAGVHRVFAGLGDGSFAELDLGLTAIDGAPSETTVVVTGGGSASTGTPTDSVALDEAPTSGPRSTPRASGGGSTAAVSGGPDVAGVDPGPEFGTTQSMLLCAPHLEDQATAGCLSASSTPTLGMLYPVSNELYVDATTGYVGIGTTFPNYPLDVEGQLVSGVSNLALGTNSAIGGGHNNRTEGEGSTVAGGGRNWALGDYSVIAGGGGPVVFDGNATQADISVISGGRDNGILEAQTPSNPSSTGSTIGGGIANEIRAVEAFSFALNSEWATISGGLQNEIEGGRSCTIGGGDTNRIVTDGFAGTAWYATISGGEDNLIEGPAIGTTIGGGRSNTASSTSHATVGGGYSNDATGAYATIAGGDQNVVSGGRAMVPGGAYNRAEGDYSMAAGRSARALHDGTFVWADDSFTAFESTAANQFLIQASGGVGIGTNAPNAGLEVVGDNEAIRANASGSSGIGVNANGGSPDGIGLLASGGAYAGYFLGEVLVLSGEDVEPSGGAFFQCGPDSSANLAMDSNEIMARNNGAVADLSLNADGGNVEMIATGTGRVGIGTNNPSAKLDVFGESTADVFRVRVDGTTRLVLDGNGGLAVGANFTPSYDLQISASAPNGGTAAKPGGGSWSNSSDRRLKKDIEDLEGALETLLALRGVTYEYIDPDAIGELHGERIGFIAQEVEEVIPDWVGEKADGMKMLTIRGFEALAVEALRELSDENERLRERVEELEADRDRRSDRLADRDERLRAELEERLEAERAAQRAQLDALRAELGAALRDAR